MKQILLLFFLTIATKSKTQTTIYHPFPDSNAYWNFYIEVYCSPMHNNIIDYYSIVIGSDTMISGNSYHTFQVPYLQSGSNGICPFYQIGYKGAFRQDTTLRKVYIVPPGDSVEQILYDFSLEVGDTVHGYLERDITSVETVVSIDSILVGGNYRKRWLINPMYQIYLIEGVGWTDGLIEASPGEMIDAFYYGLLCFSQNGSMQYPNWTSNCDLIDKVEITKMDHNIIAFPNPAKFISKMQLPLYLLNGKFKIFNSIGELIDENSVGANTNFEYDLSSFPNGIYFIKFYSIDGKYISSKLIKE